MATGLAGVFSSIDTDVLVARTVQIEGIPLTRLLGKKNTYEARKTVIESIETRFTHLEDMVGKLDTHRLLKLTARSENLSNSGVRTGSHLARSNRLS